MLKDIVEKVNERHKKVRKYQQRDGNEQKHKK